jgi:hypothetical protein
MSSLAIIAQRTGKIAIPGEHKGWTNRLQVHGSHGHIYTVSMRISDKVWGCSCPRWCTVRFCKHLDPMLPTLISAVPGSKASDPIIKKIGPKPTDILIGEASFVAKPNRSRLPPGEAERRRKARTAAMYDGSRYEIGTPGTADDWAALASAFATGDFINEARGFRGRTSKRRSNDPLLATLGMIDMPINADDLHKHYRRAVIIAFREAEFKDTAPAYVAAFAEITKAYGRLKTQNNW